MGNMSEFLGINDEANCLVHKLHSDHENSVIKDKFECCMDKTKTVRQFVHTVSQYFDLDVDSFYLIFSSYQTNFISETKTLNKSKLVEHDDRLLLDIGLVFGEGNVNRFLLYEIDPFEESEKAVCFVRNTKDSKVYPLKVDKTVTVSQLYKKVFQLCKIDGYNTDFFALILNTGDKFLKRNIEEDDTRLLREIGIVYSHNVRNVFEVCLDLENNENSNDDLYKSCASTQNQETDKQLSKFDFLNDGLSLSNIPKKRKPVSIIPKTSPSKPHNRKKETPLEYRGLVNQAMTCYLNSLLQALYMTPEFRNALYSWKYDFKDVKKETSHSISFQLQQLFLKLQTSPLPSITTNELTYSFGWDSGQHWGQSDLQEFCRVLFDDLEKELKNTTHVDLINKLYQGKLLNYVKCLECGNESSNVETFLDLPIPIRPFGKTEAYRCLNDSLKGCIEPELLEGNNQYECGMCKKKCNAHKGMKFLKFPYILSIHLMRFDYDFTSMKHIKLYDKFMFPQKLNLSSFISDKDCVDPEEASSEIFSDEIFGSNNKYNDNSCTETEISPALCDENDNKVKDLNQIKNKDELKNPKRELDGSYIYDLYAIMIHSGNASGGHYFAYIKDFKTNQWFCFNDQSVTRITIDDIRNSYGGNILEENEDQLVSSTTAYMLMYRKIDKKNNRNAMSPNEFPLHLKSLLSIQEHMDRGKEVDFFKVPVYSSNFMERGLRSTLFECNATTTLQKLKDMAIKSYNITKPCQLVIFDKKSKQVTLDLEGQMDKLVNEVTWSLPRVLLLQIVNNDSPINPKSILMKLFVVNLDDSNESIDNTPFVELEIEKNKKIEDLNDLINIDFGIPIETLLHFGIVIKDNTKLLILDKNVECSSIYNNHVFVFIQCRFMNQSTLSRNFIRIISRIYNIIQLQFVLPTNHRDLLQKCATLNNDSVNGLSKDDISIKSLDKSNVDIGNYDSNLLTEDCLTTYPQNLCDVSFSSESVGLNEHDCVTRNNSTIDEDIEMKSSTSENDLIEIDDDFETSENKSSCVTEEIREYNILSLDEKYSFEIISPLLEGNGYLSAYVDKHMNFKQLKDYLAPHLNIPIDFFTLHVIKSDDTVEPGLPENTLMLLKDFDTIQIYFDFPDEYYHGTIYCIQVLDNSKYVVTKLFNWFIAVGTSVIDTKKQLIAKLKETHGIEIPLERFRLRKKKGNLLMKCYLNEDIWNESISQKWEMVIFDLVDRSEYELDKTKQLIMVYYVENGKDSKPYIISELELVVDNALTLSANIQLAQMISTKLNISEEDIELGYTDDFNCFIWKTKVSNWSFDIFNDNICVSCRRSQKELPLIINTNNNEENISTNVMCSPINQGPHSFLHSSIEQFLKKNGEIISKKLKNCLKKKKKSKK